MPEWMQEAENAVDGEGAQKNADPSGATTGAAAGNDKMEDTMVDTGMKPISFIFLWF